MKMCLECWEFQPIRRYCLKLKKHVEPMDKACDEFKSSIEGD